MKKVLLVTVAYAPTNVVAAIRFTKISKYLHRMGYDVTVLYGKSPFSNDEIDPILENDVKDIEKKYKISYWKWMENIAIKREQKLSGTDRLEAEKMQASILSRLFSGVYSLMAGTWLLLLSYSWIRNCKKIIRKDLRGQHFDAVISTYGPLEPHLMADYIKRKQIADKWIADFRDHFVNSFNRGIVQFINNAYYKRLLKSPDAVVAISHSITARNIANAEARDVHAPAKFHTITNGYDPEDRTYLKEEPDEKVLSFAYCGTLYLDSRNPMPLFRALRELIDVKKIHPDKLRIEYAGANGQKFENYAREAGLEVINHGIVPRDVSLNLQANADIVISLTWNSNATVDGQGILTGKFFETLLVNRPVLSLISGNLKNSELGNIVKKYRLGFAYEEAAGNFGELQDWVLEKYKEKLGTGEVAFDPEPDPFIEYSYTTIAQRFTELLS